MQFILPYLRLIRLHQPIGIILLMWPCWWSIALAAQGAPPTSLLILFAFGALLMRSSGCIINDLTDRELDKQVARTRLRPLASGELHVKQALLLLAILLLLALCIALHLGTQVMLWAALSLIPVVIYPWMKRISWWPQLVLGLTFNWGALMGWVAVRGEVEWPAIMLYIAGLFWTLGYDTIYGHQDKEDDARIGIKSTALRLGEHTKVAIALFYTLMIACIAIAMHYDSISPWRLFFLAAVALHCAWQVYCLDIDTPQICRKIFLSNSITGALIWLSLL